MAFKIAGYLGKMKLMVSGCIINTQVMLNLFFITIKEIRRDWIVKECPSVKAVFMKFPCLAEPKMVCVCLFIACAYIHVHV